jgi:hypothetical protein
MSEILLVSDDVVGVRMAGPGIRAWEMARVLARRFKVILAVPDFPKSDADRTFFEAAPFEVFFYDAARPEMLLQRAEAVRIVIVQGYVLSKFPGLRDLDRPIVADIYDPFVLENLFIHQRKIVNLRDREAVHLHDLGVFNELLQRGDHFLVASDRQKDLVTGCLLALARIGPEALDAGAALDPLRIGCCVVLPPQRFSIPIPPNQGRRYPPSLGRRFVLLVRSRNLVAGHENGPRVRSPS